MQLWLTLLLVWTAGIPAAVFAAAELAARRHERRLARFAPLSRRELRPRVERLCSPRPRRKAELRATGRRPA